MSKKYPFVLLKRDDRTERAVAAVMKRRRKSCSICYEICTTGLKIMSEKTGQIFKTELSNFLHGESTSPLLYSCKTCCDSLEKVVSIKSTISILENEIANILNTLKKTGLINRKKGHGQAEIKQTKKSKVIVHQAEVENEEEDDNEANSPEMKKWLQVNGLKSSLDDNDHARMTDEDGDVIMIKEEEEEDTFAEFEMTPDDPAALCPSQITPLEFKGESVLEVINPENTAQAVPTLQDENESGRKLHPTISFHVDTPLKNDPLENHHHPTQRKSRVLADQLISKKFHQKNENDDDEEDNSSGSEGQDYKEVDDNANGDNSDYVEASDDDDSSLDTINEKDCKPTPGENKKKYMKNFSCPFCPKKYSYNKDLKKHFTKKHSDIPNADLIERPSNPAQFQCQFCPKKYCFRKDLRNHVTRHHSNIAKSDDIKEQNPTLGESSEECTKNFSCPFCPKKYFYNKDLKKHLKKLHFDKPNSDDITDEKEEQPPVNNPTLGEPYTKNFSCRFCPKKYFYNKDLKKHLNRFHSDPANPDIIPRPVNPPQFQCQFCPKKYCVRQDVRRHLKSVHSDVWNPNTHCPYCSETFIEASALREHFRTHRSKVVRKVTDPESTICDVCGKQLKSYPGLVSHRAQAHPDPETLLTPPTIPCPTCNLFYSTKQKLRRHINHVHENPGQFQCSNCTRKFNWAKNLKEHLLDCKKGSPLQLI